MSSATTSYLVEKSNGNLKLVHGVASWDVGSAGQLRFLGMDGCCFYCIAPGTWDNVTRLSLDEDSP